MDKPIAPTPELLEKARAFNKAFCAGWPQWTCPSCGESGVFPPSSVERGQCGRCRLKSLNLGLPPEAERALDNIVLDAVEGQPGQASANLAAFFGQLLGRAVSNELLKCGNQGSSKSPSA